jgi:hypothetical protein
MAATTTAASIRVQLTAYSQFSATPAYQIQAQIGSKLETVAVFGLKVNAVMPNPTDILFTVPTGGGGRLDLISQKFYGTPELWWAIAICNPGMDPMIGPTIAQVIRVPTKARLATLGILNV